MPASLVNIPRLAPLLMAIMMVDPTKPPTAGAGQRHNRKYFYNLWDSLDIQYHYTSGTNEIGNGDRWKCNRTEFTKTGESF